MRNRVARFAPMGFTVTFLGTGPSMGVPVIGCACRVCESGEAKNRRLRASIRVDAPDGTFIVDAGPDFREQALRTHLRRLDGIVLTHAHADHILGLDEVRIFNFRSQKAMPLYGTEETFSHVKRVFHYAFDPSNAYEWKPRYALNAVREGAPFRVAGIEILPVRFGHGGSEVMGFRMGEQNAAEGPFFYGTDVRSVPDKAVAALRGTNTVVLNALRYERHPTHMNLDEALDAFRRIGARRSILTHMGHEFDFRELAASLPAGVEPAFDGMTLAF